MRYEMKSEMKITENEIRIVIEDCGFATTIPYTGKKAEREIKIALSGERVDIYRSVTAIQKGDGNWGYNLETGMPCEWPKLD